MTDSRINVANTSMHKTKKNNTHRPTKINKVNFFLALGLSCCLLTTTNFADINSAKNLFENGRIDSALLELNKVISEKPDSAEARFLKGVALQALERNDEAIVVYTNLAKDFPELPEPYNNLAVLFAERSEFDKAEDALRAAIKTNKSYATAYENLGDIYAQRASIAYNDALNLSPANRNAVEVKLSMIDNILLPPSARNAMQAQVNNPAESTPTTQTTTNPASSSVAFSIPSPEVRAAVLTWAEDWSSRNIEAYLSHYAPSFRPLNGSSRSAWAKYRSERLQAPSFVIVNIAQLQSRNNTDGTVTAIFVQDYQSDGYKDTVQKTLELVNNQGTWKIQTETSKPL